MKILWITSKFPPEIGGVQRYVHQYALNMGYGVSIVLCAPSDNKTSSVVDGEMLAQGHRVYRQDLFPPDTGVLSLIKYPNYLVKFYHYINKLIREEQISVVIFGHVSFYYLYASLLLKMMAKVACIATFHGEDIPVIQMKSNILFRFLVRRINVCMCNSFFTQNRLQQFLRVKKRCIIAYPGIEERFFERHSTTSKTNPFHIEGKKILYTVGRLDARKGHDLVIKALPEIIDKHPDVVYLIAGTGPNLENLKRDVCKANLQDYVRFLGFVPDEDLPALHRAGDIFVMPNRILDDGDTEGFGIVFLEAAASGKPVIGGNAGGAVEALKDGYNGFIVDPYEVSPLAKKILYLINHKNDACVMGDRGRRRAWDDFRWSVLAHKAQDIFNTWDNI